MNRESSIEKKLYKILSPVSPKKEYVQALKHRILSASKMPVEMEHSRRIGEVFTLATVGLGVVASVAAVATVGIKIAGLLGTSAMLLKAAKSTQRKEATPSVV